MPRIKASYFGYALLQVMVTGSIWAASTGGQVLRGFALGTITMGMVVPLLISLEAGLMAMLIFEPFRGLIRRLQYLVVPYSSTEPIHLLTPVVAMLAFMLVLGRHKLAIFIASPMAKAVSILGLICAAQIFNPLQGGMFVGLSGALFVLVPMVWFYFGQHADPAFLPKALKAMVFLGILASCYGIYQMLGGYPAFEQVWIRNTDNYPSIAVYGVTRPIATFSNAEEWGRYVQIGCIIAAGLTASRSEGKYRPIWLVCAITLAVMLALTGQRSSIFGLFLGLTVLFFAGARTWGSMFARGAVLSITLAIFLFASSGLAPDERDLKRSEGFSTILSHTTKGTLDPAGEYSFGARMNTWYMVIFSKIPSNPLGNGLGESSIASTRTADRQQPPIDNHFFTLAISAGVPAALLLVWIFWRGLRTTIRLCKNAEKGSREFTTARIVMALVASLMLNNFFGTSFVIYSVAPIGWLLLGWISARGIERNAEEAAEETTPTATYFRRSRPNL